MLSGKEKNNFPKAINSRLHISSCQCCPFTSVVTELVFSPTGSHPVILRICA
nr:MAG TPA: hypothetical protein [Caudoviricetes sp.]